MYKKLPPPLLWCLWLLHLWADTCGPCNFASRRVKEDKANEQHKSINEALKAAAPEWTFEQINFVAGGVVQ